MLIKTVTWNIGGGKLRSEDADINSLSSYNKDGLEEIIQLLIKLRPDIITLQEIHADENTNQASVIAEKLGYEYVFSDFYADSHIEEGQKLGQAIISRYPISQHSFHLFYNPRWDVVWEDGSTAITHDKGVTNCSIEIDGITLDVKTLHMIPFRRFKVDPLSEKATPILKSVEQYLNSTVEHLLIQGDFNLDFLELKPLFKSLLSGVEEVIQTDPTTPKDRRLDHVLYRGLSLVQSKPFSNVLTDHYPVVTEFTVTT